MPAPQVARERWFFAPVHKRQGPVALAQLVEGLLRLPDPRACLVWKNGLPAWTPAGDVADVDRHLAPFVVARKPKTPVRPQREAEGEASDKPREEGPRARPGTGRGSKAGGPSPLVYAGAGGGVLVLGLLVWLFWPKAPPPKPKGTGSSLGVIPFDPVQGGPPGTGTGTTPSGPGPGQAGFAGWSDQEADVPTSDLGKLRQVAVWSEKTLEVTVYNGSTWRITMLFVRPSRLNKDTFVDDEKPLTLLPVGIAVEDGVDQLMNKVAPNRRKPGVNPLDTGKFLALAGNRPEAFRALITGAKGYPPK